MSINILVVAGGSQSKSYFMAKKQQGGKSLCAV